MEKEQWNSINKKQNGPGTIKNNALPPASLTNYHAIFLLKYNEFQVQLHIFIYLK